ncbi:MAG: YciI family protein [Gemmatimonadota bacterium]
MYALAILTYRAPLEVVETATEAHRAYLRQLKADGTLVASGPFNPRTGGAFLLRVPDESAAAALDAVRDGDPFFRQGIANYQLLQWNPVIGREGLDAL